MNDAWRPMPHPTPTGWRAIKGHVWPCARLAIRSGTIWLAVIGLVALTLISALLLLFRTVNPPASALMVTQRLSGVEIDNRWVPLTRVSPHVVRAVILSEDNKFCDHWGIDVGEMRAALEKAEREGGDALRGASTISQQVTKNLLLWPSKSPVRKVLEIAITIPLELIWPKARIMEVYLNIAEWGPGIFGIEAASLYHFNKAASRLTQREAALLAVSLPNPFERVAGAPGAGTQKLATTIERRLAASNSGRFTCVLGNRG